jgi:hypothetical protein
MRTVFKQASSNTVKQDVLAYVLFEQRQVGQL